MANILTQTANMNRWVWLPTEEKKLKAVNFNSFGSSQAVFPYLVLLESYKSPQLTWYSREKPDEVADFYCHKIVGKVSDYYTLN
jgi:hypothetical protein